MIDRLTEKELSERLRVKASTLRKWRLLGKGPAYIKGPGKRGAVRYLIADVETWEAANRVATRTPE